MQPPEEEPAVGKGTDPGQPGEAAVSAYQALPGGAGISCPSAAAGWRGDAGMESGQRCTPAEIYTRRPTALRPRGLRRGLESEA